MCGSRVSLRQLGRTVARVPSGAAGMAVVASRSGSEGKAQSPAVSRNGMSRSTPSSLRVTLAMALNRAIDSPYGSSIATRGSRRGSASSGNAAGTIDACSGAPAS